MTNNCHIRNVVFLHLISSRVRRECAREGRKLVFVLRGEKLRVTNSEVPCGSRIWWWLRMNIWRPCAGFVLWCPAECTKLCMVSCAAVWHVFKGSVICSKLLLTTHIQNWVLYISVLSVAFKCYFRKQKRASFCWRIFVLRGESEWLVISFLVQSVVIAN